MPITCELCPETTVYECVCDRCAREPDPKERFHTCADPDHRIGAEQKHDRIYNRNARWAVVMHNVKREAPPPEEGPAALPTTAVADLRRESPVAVAGPASEEVAVDPAAQDAEDFRVLAQLLTNRTVRLTALESTLARLQIKLIDAEAEIDRLRAELATVPGVK